MPILRYKHNGVWTEVAGASVHTHTMADVTDLPSNLPVDVAELQVLVGDVPVSDQIEAMAATKADIGHEHNNTLLYTTVSGAGAIYIPDALGGYVMDIALASDVYTDFSKLTVSYIADNYYEVYSPNSDGTINGLTAKPSFTLSVTSNITNFDATKVTISCTYQYDLDKIMQNFVLDVDDALNGETGENDYTNNVTTHTVIDNSLSIKGAAADAKATGDAIKTINNKIASATNYTHPDTHPASMITGLAAVATSGSYNDLTDKPDITGADIVVSDTYDATSSEAMSGKAVAEALQTVPSIDGLATETYVNEKIAALEIPEQAQQVQADWAETNQDSPAYIKNKPSISADGSLPVPQSAKVGQYLMVSGVDGEGAITSMTTVDTTASDWETMKNKPFGDRQEQVDLLPPTRYDGFVQDATFTMLHSFMTAQNFSFVLGEVYQVVWDDVVYNDCVAQDTSSLITGSISIGNLSNFGLSGKGEPFVIGVVQGVGIVYYSLTDTEAGNFHDVRIYQDNVVIKKIDTKYLPDDIGGSSLPEVTADDAGKFLRVSSAGAWAVESIPNAEGASF